MFEAHPSLFLSTTFSFVKYSLVKSTFVKYKFQLVLFGIWILLISIVNPMGDFPINDDWAYGHNAKVLTIDGKVYFSFWPAMTLFAQTLWATLFCKIFGFSFTVLRFATLILAFGTSLAFFALLKRHVKKHSIAFMMTLILMCNPLFVTQSFTFMTEIYYLFFGCMALLFYSNYFKNEKLFHLIIALLFSIITIWVRQTGLIIPLGFAIAYLLKKKLNWRSLIVVVLPPLIGILSLFIYKEWRLSTGTLMGSFSEFGALIDGLKNVNLDYFIQRIGVLMHYAGFALIPISVLLITRFRSKIRLLSWFTCLLVIVPLLYTMYMCWGIFPHGNVLNNFEIGPKLLKDQVIGENIALGLPVLFWNVFKVLNMLSVVIFFRGIFSVKIVHSKSGRQLLGLIDAVKKQPFLFMMFFIVAGQFIYLVINPIFFDRYVIPMAFSFLMITGILIGNLSNRKIIFGLSIASIFLVTSALLVKDFMSWQRARWTALTYLTEDLQIAKTQIDGGFEFNAWFQVANMAPPSKNKSDPSWWWVDQDNYLIASGDFFGYHKFKAFGCDPWISSNADSVYILEKRGMIPIKFPLLTDFETYSQASKTILDSNNDAFWELDGRHTNELAKSGEYSVKLVKEDAYYYLLGSLVEREVIEVSVWCNGRTGRLMVDGYGNDSFRNIEVKSKNNDCWSLLKTSFRVSKELSGKQVAIYLSNTSTRVAYFDDIRIARSTIE